ncbi:MAG TPA: Uma2 family endonuclease [Longimicrobiales bacterium]|nr:Uma2 family endonuclease [Longimicrobiales bacterium]
MSATRDLTPPPDAERPLTLEEFETLPGDDGWRSELVRGWLVREPPAGFEHGAIAARIIARLGSFVERHGLGAVLSSETGFVLAEHPATVRGPDAAFVGRERLPENPLGFARLAPDLAVEVASPSQSYRAVHDKALDYLDAGTRLVWVVEPTRRTVSVYRSRSDIRILGEGEVLEGGEVLPGLRLAVAELF